jgi:hypothetical protein
MTFESDRRRLLAGLEELGFEPYVGFMYWSGTRDSQLGFVVIGPDEKSCVKQLKEHLPKFLYGRPLSSAGFGGFSKKEENLSMQDYMVELFESGYLLDAGFYKLKSKRNQSILEIFTEPYVMNPKYVWEKAKEYFSDAEEVFSKEIPESKIFYQD